MNKINLVNRLLTRLNLLTIIKGGRGDKTNPNTLDQAQLLVGVMILMLHTNNAKIARLIAIDHLSEDPKYYTKLIKAGLVDLKSAIALAKLNGVLIMKKNPSELTVLLNKIRESSTPTELRIGQTLKVKLDGRIFNATLRGFNNPLKTKLLYAVEVLYPKFKRNISVAVPLIVLFTDNYTYDNIK